MIKVHQHALINLVYSYMVTKVFNIQPVLFHQYYLCHLLWFKKQSFMYVIMYSFETHLTRSDLITSLSSAGVLNAARVRQQIRLFDILTRFINISF